MDAGAKSKIAVFVSFICFFQVQCISFHDESFHTVQNFDILPQDSLKNVVKRGVDWSRRLSSLRSPEVPSHVAEGSEVVTSKVEAESKPPRIVRKLRIHQKNGQGVEIFKEISPESRSKEGGNGKKIVRVKKFKRKFLPTTVAPETTNNYQQLRQLSPTTTVKPKIYHEVTSTSPYSHITVINKEIKSQKKNRKNKKKKRKYQMIATSLDDGERKNNGMNHEVGAPHFHQLIGSPPMERSMQHTSYSFPDFDSYFTKIQSSISSSNQKDIYPGAEHFGQKYSLPMMNGNYKDPDFGITRFSQHSPSDASRMLGYLPNSMIRRTNASPMLILNRNSREEARRPLLDQATKLKESSTEIDEVLNKSENETTENVLNKSSDNSTEVTVEDRTGESLTTLPTVFTESTTLLPPAKKSNESESRNSSPESEIPSKTAQMEKVPIGGTAMSPQSRFPLPYPSLIYGRQNAFSDPFFDTPDIPSPMHRTRVGSQPFTPWGHRFSPFHSANDPQSDELMFGGGMEPYQSDDIIPGFRPSPQLTSLRRSILDSYGDEPTTPEPITPFSLPKFEMPSIDFNDKGCQTVYKEVKTVPDGQPQSRNSNAKSFVITRECYFPNGVPTTEGQERDVTDAPDILSMSESKDIKKDSET